MTKAAIGGICTALLLLAGCGSTKYVTTTSTSTSFATTTTTTTVTHIRVKRPPAQTVTQTKTHTLTAPSPAYAPSSSGQSFSGDGTENIGTIKVGRPSELRWSCSSCASDNFTINNNVADASAIEVNALGPTSGQTYLDPGAYHDVTINTEGGAWTITINPG